METNYQIELNDIFMNMYYLPVKIINTAVGECMDQVPQFASNVDAARDYIENTGLWNNCASNLRTFFMQDIVPTLGLTLHGTSIDLNRIDDIPGDRAEILDSQRQRLEDIIEAAWTTSIDVDAVLYSLEGSTALVFPNAHKVVEEYRDTLEALSNALKAPESPYLWDMSVASTVMNLYLTPLRIFDVVEEAYRNEGKFDWAFEDLYGNQSGSTFGIKQLTDKMADYIGNGVLNYIPFTGPATNIQLTVRSVSSISMPDRMQIHALLDRMGGVYDVLIEKLNDMYSKYDVAVPEAYDLAKETIDWMTDLRELIPMV